MGQSRVTAGGRRISKKHLQSRDVTVKDVDGVHEKQGGSKKVRERVLLKKPVVWGDEENGDWAQSGSREGELPGKKKGHPS